MRFAVLRGRHAPSGAALRVAGRQMRRQGDATQADRIAVGDHLMLGGDNIDLALAHHVEQKLGGVRLDAERCEMLLTRLPNI